MAKNPFPCAECGHSVDHHTLSELAINEKWHHRYSYYCNAGKFWRGCQCLTYAPPASVTIKPSLLS